MAPDDAQMYQASVESVAASAASTPIAAPANEPPRNSYWERQPHNDHSAGPSHEQPPPRPPKTREQPIHDAVNHAFHKSDASSQISPELIQQITEAVIKNMKSSGFDPASSAANAQPQSGPTKRNSASIAPNQVPPRNVYTPPSPEQDHAKLYVTSSRGSGMDGTSGEASKGQPYGPKMSLEREYPATQSPPVPEDTSTLEKIWQPLFEADGYPTARLGQFLRGIGLHLVEDFEPRNSLVITPAKMKRFYEEVKLPEEIFPWTAIFSGALAHSSLSHMYRDLYCEHHFVQKEPIDKPTVPALTPHGFQLWMTHVIRAYPEEEAMRFAKVLQKYAINNADDRKERFPKQLPRCLFPKSSHKSSRHDMEDIVLSHPDLKGLRRPRGQSDAQSMPQPPPPPPPPTSNNGQAAHHAPPPPPHYANVPLREPQQQAFSSSISEGALDEGGRLSSSIERERKPYSAVPGAGRSQEVDTATSGGVRRTQSNAGSRPSFDDEAPRARNRRSESNASYGARPTMRRNARSPSALRDDSGEDLTKLSSRDGRDGHGGDRRSRQTGQAQSAGGYEDDHRRSAAGAAAATAAAGSAATPATHGYGNYQYPAAPRY